MILKWEPKFRKVYAGAELSQAKIVIDLMIFSKIRIYYMECIEGLTNLKHLTFKWNILKWFSVAVHLPLSYCLAQPNWLQGAIFLQIRYGFRMEKYSHILNWCGRIFIKGHTRNRECRRDCSFTKLVYPFNNKMIWFVILMHQNFFLSLKTSLFQVYGNIEIVEGYSSQTY